MSKIYYGLRSASELDDFFEKNNTFSEEEPYIIRVKRFTAEDIVPLHCARSFEILFSSNTHGMVTINNKAYDLGGEQVFAIPPNVVHSTTIGKCDGYLYTMQLSLEDLKKYIDIEQIAMFSGLRLSDIAHRCPETEQVKLIFERLIEHDRDICFCFSQILQLFSILFRYREVSPENISSQYKKSQSVDDTLRNVLAWTLDNYTSNITIETVASVAGYTRVYFCNWFKEKTGITYMTHLTNVRNTNVCLLLKSGFNVTEACYKCGFNNLSHFVKQFKRKYGVTPKQYAAMYGGKITSIRHQRRRRKMVVTIKNDSIEARINPLGAELESLFRVSTGMEYLCPKEKPIWKEQAPILFPFVGKLKNEYYLFEGKKYSAQTHGFGRKKLFDLMEKTDSAAAFRLTSNEDTRQDYPFDFSLSVVYRLDGDQLYVSTTMENTGDGPLYYAVGFHPGFLCPLQPSLRAEDYYLVFDPPLTASIAVMDGYMIDHTEKRYNNCPRIKISRELFSQGAVTLTDLSSHRVRLCTDDSPHYVEVAFDDYTELALWTPTEKEMEIKYICIEPRCGLQDFSSGDNELINKPGMIAVSAKGYDRRQFSITVK